MKVYGDVQVEKDYPFDPRSCNTKVEHLLYLAKVHNGIPNERVVVDIRPLSRVVESGTHKSHIPGGATQTRLHQFRVRDGHLYTFAHFELEPENAYMGFLSVKFCWTSAATPCGITADMLSFDLDVATVH